ncbi:MAG: hypothetical protein AAF950_04940 [Pseudomonadota bacterium]
MRCQTLVVLDEFVFRTVIAPLFNPLFGEVKKPGHFGYALVRFTPYLTQAPLRPLSDTAPIMKETMGDPLMFEFLMMAAQHPSTPWVVLIGLLAMIVVEAWKVSDKALMGDMFADGIDD